jgi:hypothetical protein
LCGLSLGQKERTALAIGGVTPKNFKSPLTQRNFLAFVGSGCMGNG